MICPRRYSRPVCPTRRDELLGQVFLFVIFYAACGIIIAFFTVVPIYSAGEGRRDDSAWRQGSRTLRDVDQSKRTWREHSLRQVRKQRLPLLGSQWLRWAPTDPNPLAAGGHEVWTDRDGGGARSEGARRGAKTLCRPGP